MVTASVTKLKPKTKPKVKAQVIPIKPPPDDDGPNWRSARNIRWIERHLHIPEGKFVGQKVKLTEEQKSWMVQIYDTPTRTFILSMGRKNAKTSFSAFLLLLHLCGPEQRRNSQLNSAAQSREQAAILFSLAAKMVRMSPDLNDIVKIRDSAKQLHCPDLGTLYRALSADASTAFGLSPCFTVHDELGQVKGPRSELYEALETASAAHESPLSIIISTQAPTDADLLSILIDDGMKEGGDPRVKVVLYTASEEMDPFSEEAIRAANPHYDVFMDREEVKRQASSAKRMPTSEASFRNLILNQRVEVKQSFVTKSVWQENGAPPNSILRKRVYGGLDLSSVHDLTAQVLLSEEGDVVPTFWLPEEGLKEKSRADRVPYDMWAEQGFLRTTPGRAISYKMVAEDMRRTFDTHEVVAIGFDRYNMKHLRPWLVAAGFTDKELERFVEFGQGFASMSPAIRVLEEDLLGVKLRHGNHPVLAMCAHNAVVAIDPAESRKFVKGKNTGRIDGMVALAMAEGVRPRSVPPPAKKHQLFFA
jgi:phage terminase large subunit-like protein